MLIGLSGLAGSGKSEIASALMSEFGFQRIKFASPLKNMVRTMLADMGHCASDVERMVEGDLKEVEIPEIGVSPRHLMVTLGTEWGRDCVAKDLWIRLWHAQVETAGPGALILVDDVRFPNEVEALRSLGGELWRIERPGVAQGDHESERLEARPDLIIVNDRTLAGLHAAATGLVRNRVARCA